jgi:hypothetical protein
VAAFPRLGDLVKQVRQLEMRVERLAGTEGENTNDE